MDEITNKLQNIELVVEEVKLFPQTYKTILKEKWLNGTCQLILRRKINKLCKLGGICKTSIPGTRFGEVILYVLPKKYFILVEESRITGSNTFVFFNFEKLNNYYIKVMEYWQLNKIEWIKKEEEKTFFNEKVLKFI